VTVKEQLTDAVSALSEEEAAEVARFVRVLRLRSPVQRRGRLDEPSTMALYAEAAEEDVALAETGMDDYGESVSAEDAR
jgi:hypothetical protein